jgi:nucleotide-binding universal stress UspA family protein
MAPRIVVGVDGSAASRLALRWASDEGRLRHGALEVVLVWHHPVANFIPMYGPSPEKS